MKKTIFSVLLMTLTLGASAQEFPARPVRLVVPFAAGSTIELLGRAVAQALTERLGQQVVVEARPGAGSGVGAAAVAGSTPDGYTLLLASNATLAVNPVLYKSLAYDPNGFRLIGATGGFPSFMLVGGGSKYKTLPEFVKAAKDRPGTLKYASSGVGSTGHLVGAVLESTAGLELVHVPYKDGPQGLLATMTGDVDAIFYPSGAAMPMISAGKVLPLAVSTATRSKNLPGVPTIAESGFPGFDLIGWTLVAAPGKTPAPIVDKLRESFKAVHANPAYEAKVESLGLVMHKLVGKDLEAFVQTEQRTIADVARRAKIQPE